MRYLNAASRKPNCYLSANQMSRTLCIVLFCAMVSVMAFEPEMSLDGIGMIKYWGYPAERYVAKTEDGWLLPLYRIPHGVNDSDSNVSRPVVILQHGLECDGESWIMNPPSSGAGYIFADAGMDVWLFNSRGTKSTAHIKYTPDDPGFWNYTYVDMITYDLDASFNVVEEVTGQTSFHYVGHSQGTLIMFAKLAEVPTFSSRVSHFFALGPTTSMRHASGIFESCVTSETPVFEQIWNAESLSPFFGSVLDPNNVAVFSKTVCYGSRLQNEFCAGIYYSLFGPSTTTNVSRVPVYFTHIPAGSSTLNVQMFCQNKLHGGFYKYRYPTKEQNVIAYGQPDPPAYNLTNIKARIYLYSSHEDIITSRVDMDEFTIPRITDSVVEDNIIDGFSHADFLLGLDAPKRVYQPIMKIIFADQ